MPVCGRPVLPLASQGNWVLPFSVVVHSVSEQKEELTIIGIIWLFDLEIVCIVEAFAGLSWQPYGPSEWLLELL